MKTFLIMLTFAILSAFTHNPMPIEVNWNKDLKLTKDHFQISYNLPQGKAATIATSINLIYNYNGTFRPRAIAFMNTRESYIKATMTDWQLSVVLNHEKRHFDVTEYITRCINTELMRLSNNPDEANKVYNKYISKLDSMQILYDKQSDHCLDTLGQKKWDRALDSLLRIK